MSDALRLLDIHEGLKSEAEAACEAAAEQDAADAKARRRADLVENLLEAAHSAMSGQPSAAAGGASACAPSKANDVKPCSVATAGGVVAAGAGEEVHSVHISIDRSGGPGLRSMQSGELSHQMPAFYCFPCDFTVPTGGMCVHSGSRPGYNEPRATHESLVLENGLVLHFGITTTAPQAVPTYGYTHSSRKPIDPFAEAEAGQTVGALFGPVRRVVLVGPGMLHSPQLGQELATLLSNRFPGMETLSSERCNPCPAATSRYTGAVSGSVASATVVVHQATGLGKTHELRTVRPILTKGAC